jgi:hypothetical protein
MVGGISVHLFDPIWKQMNLSACNVNVFRNRSDAYVLVWTHLTSHGVTYMHLNSFDFI